MNHVYIIIYSSLVILLCIFLLVLYFTLVRRSISSATATPFECGFESFSVTRRPFSLRYFILVVLFVVFDVEVVLMFPCTAQLIAHEQISLYINLYLFLLLLFVGLLYEWRNNMLEWVS